MNFDRVIRFIGAAAEIPHVVAQARERYTGSLTGVMKKLYLSLRQRYLPHEALYEGLLDPSLPDSVFENRISRSSLSKLQERRNPLAWETLLADKTVFYKFCMVAGIPVPPLLAIFSSRSAGWVRSGQLIESADGWFHFFDRECPPEIVIKPSRGCHGAGILFLHRENGHFIDQEGKHLTPGDLIESLTANRQYHMFAVQERIRNHEDIVRFTGTSALQTVRMITVLQPDGDVLLAHAHIKLIAGNRLYDNYGSGQNENIMAEVNRESGQLKEILLTHGKPVLTHPRTSRPIAGFQIPFWREACATVKESAKKFAPIGTVGWDLAVTPEGPVVIEGNIWYDPPSPSDISFFLSSLRHPGGSHIAHG